MYLCVLCFVFHAKHFLAFVLHVFILESGGSGEVYHGKRVAVRELAGVFLLPPVGFRDDQTVRLASESFSSSELLSSPETIC